MSDIPVDEIQRIVPSLTAAEQKRFGDMDELSPQGIRSRLQDLFGRDFPEVLWRRHKSDIDGLRHVHHLLTDQEWSQLGETDHLQSPAAYAQRILEVFDATKVEQLKVRLAQHREGKQREREGRHLDTTERVDTYDFRHPARVNRDQLRTLENLHESFARLFSVTLSAAMRRIVHVDTAFVDQTTYREFIMSLSNPAASYQFVLGPTNGHAILDFALPVVFGLVDRVFGGAGSSGGVEARQMSQIEMGVLAQTVRRTIQDLEATWTPFLPDVRIHDIELETNPEFMQISAPNEICILLAFEVNAPGMSGLVSLCYPFFTLESILPRLGQITQVRHGRPSREETHIDNRLRLGAMDLPVVAEFGRTTIPMAQATSLAVGDVIRLDARTDDPACVFLGGQPKFLGWPVVHGRDAAVVLAGRIPPPVQTKYGQTDADLT